MTISSTLKKLNGHRAVITGASSGIGKEYARQLAELGSDLVIAARRIDRLNTLAEELRKTYSVQVDCVQVDLCEKSAPRKLFEASTANGKMVTILVNNAGLGKYGSFLDFPYPDHETVLQVNTISLTEATYLFAQHMVQHKKPSYISQVASIAAFQPVGNFAVYSATKGYVRYFTEALAYELRKSNVQVSCTCPGGTYTEFMEHSGQTLTKSGHATMMTVEAVVSLSLHAMLNKKRVYIPGFLNKLGCFIPRFLPRDLGTFLGSKTLDRSVTRTLIKKI